MTACDTAYARVSGGGHRVLPVSHLPLKSSPPLSCSGGAKTSDRWQSSARLPNAGRRCWLEFYGPHPDLLDEVALQGCPVFRGRANSSHGAHWHLDTSPANGHRSVSGTSTLLPSQLRLCWHLTLCGHMKESSRQPPGSQATITAQSVSTQSHT